MGHWGTGPGLRVDGGWMEGGHVRADRRGRDIADLIEEISSSVMWNGQAGGSSRLHP